MWYDALLKYQGALKKLSIISNGYFQNSSCKGIDVQGNPWEFKVCSDFNFFGLAH